MTRIHAGPFSHVLLLLAALALVPAGHADGDAAATAGVGSWYALPSPDQSDWSPKRIQRHAALDPTRFGEPLAVIRVPDLAVAAQVFSDVDNQALEAGAAWVSATTRPGETGNIAIAGHRDSYFRPLEDIPLGTRISMTTSQGERFFTVSSVEIVDPLDTSPLAPTAETTLTLITCYPFRYKGFAPDRYIIRAVLNDSITQAEPADSALRTIPATKGETL